MAGRVIFADGVQAALPLPAVHVAPAVPPARPRRVSLPLAPAEPCQQLYLLEGPPPIPATYAECKGPAHRALMAECGGACPVLRCRHHVALHVKDNGAIHLDGGVGRGRTARGTRALTDQAEDALATLVVDLADRLALASVLVDGQPDLASMCTLDYAERYRLTPKGLRWLLGLRTRRMTKLLTDAADELDIARARIRRQEAAAKADEHRRREVERAELAAMKRKPKPCK